MGWTPVLHFSGRFRFHMPEYNNDPTGPGVKFDPSLPADRVAQLCGCDPSKYFEFSLFDTEVTQITYSDGSTSVADEPVIGMPLTLDGFMVDVSPTAICALVFCFRFQIGTLLQGSANKGIQSDLRLNIRPLGFTDESAAAHFDFVVRTASPLPPLAGSRARSELGANQVFNLHLHLNRYTRLDNQSEPLNHLTGDAYGYIRPVAPSHEPNETRIQNIRLVAHPDIKNAHDIEATYVTNTGKTPFMRITDIDGFYDIDRPSGLLSVHYLDFVPFLDRNRQTPQVTGYEIFWESPTGRSRLATFPGNLATMQRNGGLEVCRIPQNLSDGFLSVDVVRLDGSSARLMLESEWDIQLESDRGIYIVSGGSAQIQARVYRRNRPVAGHVVDLSTQPSNRRSPIVAHFKEGQVVTDGEGRIRATIQALDLTNTGGISDPVTGSTVSSIALDRFCGNYLYLRIANPLRRTDPPVEEVEIAARVLHRIDSIDGQPSFMKHIKPMFSMYVRYFPWLHVVPQGSGYSQFLNLESVDDVRNAAVEIVARLGMDQTDRRRMPRSRDFPIGGREMIQKWIDAGMPD